MYFILESHIAGLLYSDVSKVIINQKIDQILDSPQGNLMIYMFIRNLYNRFYFTSNGC